MEDVRRVAIETAHIIATPDALKADSAVEILAFLEEEGAVGPSANSYHDPGVLAWVALDVAQDVKCHQHQNHVNRHN